jgi:hypothetical protein
MICFIYLTSDGFFMFLSIFISMLLIIMQERREDLSHLAGRKKGEVIGIYPAESVRGEFYSWFN